MVDPEFRYAAPIAVIGSGRSGTSLVSEVLKALGVFMGARQNVHQEALFFVRINAELLTAAGGRWDDPEPVRVLLSDSAARARWRDRLLTELGSRRFREFRGRRRLLGNDALALDEPWGWKDPRTTFTLPLWLEIFPHARVIHVLRHGVDVAQSDRVSTAKLRAARQRQGRMRRLLDRTRTEGVRATVSSSLRRRIWRAYGVDSDDILTKFDSIEHGVDLWERYVDEARGHVAALGNQAIEIRYETLLAEPKAVVRDLADFAGGSWSRRVDEIVGNVNSGRAFAYRKDPQLIAEARRLAPRLRTHGYEPG